MDFIFIIIPIISFIVGNMIGYYKGMKKGSEITKKVYRKFLDAKSNSELFDILFKNEQL